MATGLRKAPLPFALPIGPVGFSIVGSWMRRIRCESASAHRAAAFGKNSLIPKSISETNVIGLIKPMSTASKPTKNHLDGSPNATAPNHRPQSPPPNQMHRPQTPPLRPQNFPLPAPHRSLREQNTVLRGDAPILRKQNTVLREKTPDLRVSHLDLRVSSWTLPVSHSRLPVTHPTLRPSNPPHRA